MKKSVILSIILCFLFSYAFSKDIKIVVKISNKSKLAYTNEVVGISWKSLLKKDNSLSKENVSVVEKSTGKAVVSQISDNDGNGTPDELLLFTSLSPNETKEFEIVKVKEAPKYDPLVSLKFVQKREDIAWESDRIAYRIYGPALAKDVNNGFDIWTKRVKYPIVDKWYTHSEKYATDGKDTYHQDTGEGADFYSVGKTLGAGSAALWKNDSLYQPGVFDTYKFIEAGPIRTIFEVNYKAVSYNGNEISEKKRISIDAGSNLNKVEVIYDSKNKDAKIEVAAGVVKRKGVTSSIDKNDGIVSLWGATNDDPVNEFLGIGVVFPKNIIKDYSDNEKHLLVIGKGIVSKPVIYYSGAGWTRSGDFSKESDWNQYLVDFANKLKNKLVIKVK